MKNRATIIDIANLLNVTPATVSRALNNSPEIGEKTKQRVLEAAKSLDYHRNNIASSLRKGSSQVIGVLIPSAAHSFFGEIVHGIANRANDYGYDILIYQSNENYENEIKGIQTFLNARVDGILASIAKNTYDYDHFLDVKKQNVPIAFFDRINDDLDIPTVSVNDYQGAFDATAHLIAQGYRRIAHLAGQQYHKIFKARLDGYKAALAAYGLPYLPEYVYQGDITKESGRAGAQYFLQLVEPPDAIFAVEDYAAIGVICELQDRSINVPSSIGVFGFCNDVIGSYLSPSLSTIDQQTELMGQQAFELIYEIVKSKGQNQEVTKKIILDPISLIRQSSNKLTP